MQERVRQLAQAHVSPRAVAARPLVPVAVPGVAAAVHPVPDVVAVPGLVRQLVPEGARQIALGAACLAQVGARGCAEAAVPVVVGTLAMGHVMELAGQGAPAPAC